MTKKVTVKPSWLQPGDHVLSEQHDVEITYIDGPDHAGVYDMFGINEEGKAQKIVATDFVTVLV